MKKSLISIAIAMAVMAGSAHAERALVRNSHSIDRTHTNLSGGVSMRHMQQNVTPNGFTRNLVKTAPNGATATRDTAVVNDVAAGTHTRTVNGTTFDGAGYSGAAVTQKTEDGVSHVSSFTGVNGNTSARSADLSVDQESGTLTKNISATGPRGQTSSTTVVRQLNSVEGRGETSVE